MVLDANTILVCTFLYVVNIQEDILSLSFYKIGACIVL